MEAVNYQQDHLTLFDDINDFLTLRHGHFH